jgi:hypothetical protein
MGIYQYEQFGWKCNKCGELLIDPLNGEQIREGSHSAVMAIVNHVYPHGLCRKCHKIETNAQI